MNIRKIALWIGIFSALYGGLAFATGEEGVKPGDEETNPTVVSKTYIESGPFGFLKIEIPFPGKARGEEESGEDKKGAFHRHNNLWLLPFFHGTSIERPPTSLFRVSVLKVPLIGFWFEQGRSFIFSDDRNPFQPVGEKAMNIAFLEQPLFCLYDMIRIYQSLPAIRKEDWYPGVPTSWEAKRSRWLDTPLVSLWEIEQWSNGKYYRWMFLDTLLATTLGREKGPAKSAFRILDSPNTGFVSGFRYLKDDKERETRVLSVLGGAAWDSRQKKAGKERSLLRAPLRVASVWESEEKKERKEWTFLRALFLQMATGSVEKEKQQITILGTKSAKSPLFLSGFRYLKDDKERETRVLSVLAGAVWDSRQKKERKERSLLRAPLRVASVWESEEKKESKKWTFLRVLFLRAATGSVEKGVQEWTILGTKSAKSPLFRDRAAAPALALWFQDRQNEETSSRQFLRLPLIGPVWASWEDEEAKQWGFFPRIVFSKKFKY